MPSRSVTRSSDSGVLMVRSLPSYDKGINDAHAAAVFENHYGIGIDFMERAAVVVREAREAHDSVAQSREIAGAKVLLTLLGGRPVWRDPGFAY